MSTLKRLLALCLVCLFALPGLAEDYAPTNRDTRYEPVTMDIPEPDFDGFEPLYETASAQYYWREDRDVIAVYDKESGYTWKTGLDTGFPADIKDQVKQAQTDEEKIKAAQPLEAQLNARYIGIANSLLTAEYYEAETIKFISSASREGASSALVKLDQPGRFALDVSFEEIDLQVKVNIAFEDKGISYHIPFDGLKGAGLSRLAALWITPFLGASGGVSQVFDPQAMDYGPAQPKAMTPGYVLVPDGPGALIRFRDNTVTFKEYVGEVYGDDYATATYYYNVLTDAVSLKQPVMPVFGIAHGHEQAAFVAFARQGAEHMSIVARPEENLRIKYTWAHPRFEYNATYYKVYNRYGEGFFSLMSAPLNYDIQMTYRFLSGAEATWAGMARAYRAHLRSEGSLTELEASGDDIPIRLDIILSDIKKGLIGPEQVVVTTARDAGEMLTKLNQDGIRRISSGLIGWQDGAQTLAQPGSLRFYRGTGDEQAFKTLAREQDELGTQVELARDFARVNEKMVRYNGNAVQHLNTWFVNTDYSWRYPKAPVTQYSLARPDVAAKWLQNVAKRAGQNGLGLMVTGLPGLLVSTHRYEGPEVTRLQAKDLLRDAFQTAGQDASLSLDQPNLYLWNSTRRYLQAPVTGSQHVFESDNVPFLQMVLQGSMDVHGPYSNFSFYAREDILRMIDYHTYPSFILSRQPAHLLVSTMSADLYSTEFSQYEQLVKDTYDQVNAALGQLVGWQWQDRTMLQQGVAQNTYARDGQIKHLIINYTHNAVDINGTSVPAQNWTLEERGAHGQ